MLDEIIVKVVDSLDNNTIIEFRDYLLDEKETLEAKLEIYAVQVEHKDFRISFFNKNDLKETIEFLCNKIRKSFEEEVKEFKGQVERTKNRWISI